MFNGLGDDQQFHGGQITNQQNQQSMHNLTDQFILTNLTEEIFL